VAGKIGLARRAPRSVNRRPDPGRRDHPVRRGSGALRQRGCKEPREAPASLVRKGGFSLASLFRMRQFYLAFPEGSAIRGEAQAIFSTPLRIFPEEPAAPSPKVHFPSSLAWSRYLVLVRIANDHTRVFYEIEAAPQRAVTGSGGRRRVM